MLNDLELRELAASGDHAGLLEAMSGVTATRAASLVSDLLVFESNEAAPALLLEAAFEVLGEEHGILWMHRGLLSVLAQDFEAAERYYRRAVECERPDQRAYTSLSTLLLRSNRADDALEVARQGHLAMPDDPISFGNYVYALEGAGHHEEALRLLREQGTMLPENSRAGLIADLESQDDLPIVFVDRFPDGARRAFELGSERYRAGDLLSAIEFWRRGMRLDPLDEEMAVELGATLSELGRDAEALAVYETFAELTPYSLLCMNHGNTLLRLERLAEAVAAYELCLNVLPSWVDPRVNMASALMGMGRLDEAQVQLGLLLQHGVDPGLHAALVQQLATFRSGSQ